MTDERLDLDAIAAMVGAIENCEDVPARLVHDYIPRLVAELRACGKREHELHGKLNSAMLFPANLEELAAARARVAELEAAWLFCGVHAIPADADCAMRQMISYVKELETKKAIDPGYVDELEARIKELETENKRLDHRIGKWERWEPTIETLREMKEQARRGPNGERSRAAQGAYIGHLEYHHREMAARVAELEAHLAEAVARLDECGAR